jgi:hypothetical protein
MSLPSSLQDASDDTLARFCEIRQVPVTFDTPKEEACKEVVNNLSDEEIQSVAEISDAYWALSKLQDDAASPEVARKMAAKKMTEQTTSVPRGHVEKETQTTLQQQLTIILKL